MRAEELPREQISFDKLGPRWALYASAVGALGVIATTIVAATAENGAERFFQSYLVGFSFFLSLALGCLFFVVITHLTRAGWSVAVRRLAEAVSLTLIPLALLALVIVLPLALHFFSVANVPAITDLYQWADLGQAADHAGQQHEHELLVHKSSYLNVPFFLVRMFVYFAAWILIAWFFASRSRIQDASGDPALTVKMERVSAVSAIVFALTISFASIDLLMSLYPIWYSTIYGVYFFSGSALGGFSLLALLMYLFQRADKLNWVVNLKHYHDVGKLMFAFVVFWAYIAFSQFMLIWYGNIPEETQWYLVRQEGVWPALSLFLLFGHFFVPFLWLMSQHVKRRKGVLALAAVWLLLVHWFDLFWLVMPEKSPHSMPFHLLDLTVVIGLGGIFCAFVFWRLGRASLIPMRDPRLPESLGMEHV